MLLWVGTASSLAFAALSLTAAQRGIFDLDRRTQAFLSLTWYTSLHGPMDAVSLLGQASALVPLIALASFLVWRYNRRWALALPIVMVGMGVLQLVAKRGMNRPRPNGAPWGFPSGHTLSVVVLFGVIAYLVWTSRMRRRWRCLGATICTTTAFAVAFSRLYLAMHWLSDVGGGFSLGLAYLSLAIWCVEVILPPDRRSSATFGSPADLVGDDTRSSSGASR